MKTLSKTLPLVLILALSACSGTMQGVTRGTGEAVKFSYEQGMNSDMLTAVVGTETFKGKAVPRGRQSIQATTWSGDAIFGSSSPENSWPCCLAPVAPPCLANCNMLTQTVSRPVVAWASAGTATAG